MEGKSKARSVKAKQLHLVKYLTCTGQKICDMRQSGMVALEIYTCESSHSFSYFLPLSVLQVTLEEFTVTLLQAKGLLHWVSNTPMPVF